jgi:ketosteroid isomerase-like protein
MLGLAQASHRSEDGAFQGETEMSVRTSGLALLLTVAAASQTTAGAPGPSPADLQRQVTETERAFAKTMADRDHKAFSSFLADEAIFLGEARTRRGKQEVAEGWRPLFDGPQAPFSWEPERVEVLESGALALSSGPVLDPKGQRVGTFNSVWRREADGRWRIIFDKGCPPCKCP